MMKSTAIRTGAIPLVAAMLVVSGLSVAVAQSVAPAQPVQADANANLLSLADIETRMTAQGIKIKEIEIQDLLVEVEGFDAQGRKIELKLDRRTGDVLSQRVKDKR